MKYRKKSGGIDVFSVNRLGNNDAPENKESSESHYHITFNGICHSTKNSLN